MRVSCNYREASQIIGRKNEDDVIKIQLGRQNYYEIVAAHSTMDSSVLFVAVQNLQWLLPIPSIAPFCLQEAR